MDDGLTALSGRCRAYSSAFYPDDSGDYWYFTFIGTGLSVTGSEGHRVWFQNLPYGSHILKILRPNSSTGTATLDSIDLQSSHANFDRGLLWDDITFHQPKRPPIPEHACVIADYMLMADFVAPPNNTAGSGVVNKTRISKGVRRQNNSRDVFYKDHVGTNHAHNHPESTGGGMRCYGNANTKQVTLPYFGNDIVYVSGVSTNRTSAAHR